MTARVKGNLLQGHRSGSPLEPHAIHPSRTTAMPIYEYRCDRCGSEFEQLVLKTSSAPECPSCQGQDLTRLLSLSRVTSQSMRTRAFHEADRNAQRKRQEQERAEHDDHTH